MAGESASKSSGGATKPAAERGTQSNPDAEKAPEEARYSVETLIENAYSWLGVPSYGAVGAFFGEDRKTLTRAEAQELVDAFLKRPEEGSE